MKIPTPGEIASELVFDGSLTEDEANSIAATVYQPLKEKLDAIENAVLRLVACNALELGVHNAEEIIKDLSGDL